MTQKERKQQERDINDAVNALMMAVTAMARKKAREYELSLLCEIRDRIQQSIDIETENEPIINRHVANKIEEQLNK